MQRQEQITIATKAKLSSRLVDKRIMTTGIVFGTIEDVARQYGIKCHDNGKYRLFTGPKNRLQLFAEKLHFSCINFSEIEEPGTK